MEQHMSEALGQDQSRRQDTSAGDRAFAYVIVRNMYCRSYPPCNQRRINQLRQREASVVQPVVQILLQNYDNPDNK